MYKKSINPNSNHRPCCLLQAVSLFLFLCVNSIAYSQQDRMPTPAEKATFLKSFQTILQNVPTHFEKIRKGSAIDFFGQQTYISSVRLFPIEGAQPTQSIFYITEKDGKSVKSYSEAVPFSFQSCLDMLAPVFKQLGMTEVPALRKADSSLNTRSFKGKNAVVELTANPIIGGAIVVIGKPYYYYTTNAAVVVNNNNAGNGKENGGIKPTADTKNMEEKILKGLTKLYKSALASGGSFEEFKKGTSEITELTQVYNVTAQLQLESVNKANLFVPKQSGYINGLAIDIAGTSTAAYLSVLNKMTRSAETAGEITAEKKNGLTRYSYQSKALKTELISLLDFEQAAYNDVLLFNTAGNKADTGNQKSNPKVDKPILQAKGSQFCTDVQTIVTESNTHFKNVRSNKKESEDFEGEFYYDAKLPKLGFKESYIKEQAPIGAERYKIQYEYVLSYEAKEFAKAKEFYSSVCQQIEKCLTKKGTINKQSYFEEYNIVLEETVAKSRAIEVSVTQEDGYSSVMLIFSILEKETK